MVTFNTFGEGSANESNRVFTLAHRSSDVDRERSSQHHTLGRGPNQAAPGNHNHYEDYAPADHSHASEGIGTVIMFLGETAPSIQYLMLDGSGITRDDYPELFTVLGIPSGTNFTYLPDYRDRFPVGASGTKALNSTGQTNMVDPTPTANVSLTKANVGEPTNPATDVEVVTDVDVTIDPIDLNNPVPPWVAVNFFVKAF